MKKLSSLLAASALALQVVTLPLPALAQAPVKCTFTGFLTSFDCVKKIGETSGVKETDPVKVVLSIIQVGLTLAAIIGVIALIISGVRYILSAGEEGEAKKAKNGIIYAVIGLLIIGASILIVNIVINAFTTASPAPQQGPGVGVPQPAKPPSDANPPDRPVRGPGQGGGF